VKTNYPDSLTIQQYLEGKLDPEVMHQLEKQALDDPFLWDALEGYASNADAAHDLSILQRQLHERIVHLQENKKVFDLTWQRLSVAAAAAVLFVSAGILFWMNSHKPAEQLAANHKQVEVNIIDRDSVHAVINSGNETVVAAAKPVEIDRQKENVTAYSPSAAPKKAAANPEAPEAEVATVAAADAVISADHQVVAMSAPAARMAKTARSENYSQAEVAVAPATAQPKEGWDSYHRYLEQNTKKFSPAQAQKGGVLISVQVGADGKLSNVKVVRSLNEAYDKEAIRLVKDGPEWIGSPDGKAAEMMVEISF
jgi:TonB family protein